MRSDLAKFAAAVRFRDRAAAAAVVHHERAGLAPSQTYARATFDAIEQMIREDEREKLVDAGRLLPPDTDTRVECDIDWVDVRSANPRPNDVSYSWSPEEFDRALAAEIRAADRFHRAPARIRKRIVRTFAEGSTLVGPWHPVPSTQEAP